MAMFIDDPVTLVDDAVCGVCLTSTTRLARIANTNVVVNTAADAGKVLLLCGGGAGHEPAHVGYVARGWLTPAVCGSVFASPPTAHVSAAIECLWQMQQRQRRQQHAGNDAHDALPGILVVVKNYAGDLLNFNFAVQQAREHGIRVTSVLAADDVIFGDADVTRRRGLAGCCLLYKMLSAAAAGGASLDDLVRLATRTSAQLRSVGACLTACTLPGAMPAAPPPPPSHASEPNANDVKVELGRGIHGEEGLLRVPFANARTLTSQLVCLLVGTDAQTTATTTSTGSSSKGSKENNSTGTSDVYNDALAALREHVRATPLPAHSNVVLLVNNLGTTTDLEMYTVATAALDALAARDMHVVAVHVGRHMTSLNAHGLSLTLLRIVDETDLRYVLDTDALQAPLMNFAVPPQQVTSTTPAAAAANGRQSQCAGIRELPGPLTALQLAQQQQQHTSQRDEGDAAKAVTMLPAVLQRVCEQLCAAEPHLNALDAAVGDGDLGSGVARAARAVLSLVPHLSWAHENALQSNFALMAKGVADACAGTSGPLLGVLLLAGGAGAQAAMTSNTAQHNEKGEQQCHGDGNVRKKSDGTATTRQCAALRAAIRGGADAIQSLGGAHKGDRTMVDALLALVDDVADNSDTTNNTHNADAMQTLLQAYSYKARHAADAVRQLRARFGRSRYMDGKEIGKPDPGCELIAMIAQAAANAHEQLTMST